MGGRQSRRLDGQARRTARRSAGTALALLALSAHLILPLVFTCRTYRSLFLEPVPSCCAAKSACASAAGGTERPSLRGTRGCPYCKAAAPFRHANFTPAAAGPGGFAPLSTTVSAAPESLPAAPPDLSAASPRGPPSSC